MDPPRAQGGVGDEDAARMQPQGFGDGLPGQGQGAVVQPAGAASHEPQAFAAAVADFAGRQGFKADAAAFGVVQGQLFAALQHRCFGGQPPAGAQQAYGGGGVGLVAGIVAREGKGQRAGQKEVGFAALHFGAEHGVDGVAYGHAVGTDGARYAGGRSDVDVGAALQYGVGAGDQVVFARGGQAVGANRVRALRYGLDAAAVAYRVALAR